LPRLIIRKTEGISKIILQAANGKRICNRNGDKNRITKSIKFKTCPTPTISNLRSWKRWMRTEIRKIKSNPKTRKKSPDINFNKNNWCHLSKENTIQV